MSSLTLLVPRTRADEPPEPPQQQNQQAAADADAGQAASAGTEGNNGDPDNGGPDNGGPSKADPESDSESAAGELPAAESETGNDVGDPAAASDRDRGPVLLALPSAHRDGRPLRPIGVYQSQLVDVVPKNFRPVSVEQLFAALAQDSERTAEETETRLVSGFYDIRLDGRVLVSERSELVIEHPRGVSVRKSLGRVNFALTSLPSALLAGRSEQARVPRLQADSGGQLVAVIPAVGPAPADTSVLPSAENEPEAASDAESQGAESQGAESEDAKSEDAESDAAESDAAESDPAADGDAAAKAVEDPLPAIKTSELRFGWTLRGQSVGEARRFELLIPRTSQTRVLISTPRDIHLESRQGVLVERPGPPPDADVQSRTGDIRWYVLEAGGLNRIELFVTQHAENEAERPVLIRRESRQYSVTLADVSWKHRISLETPGRREQLRFRIPEGTLTHVRLNAAEAAYQVNRRDDGSSIVEVDLPRDLDESPRSRNGTAAGPSRGTDNELLTVTLEGTSGWELTDGSCNLMSASLIDTPVIYTESSTQAVVSVVDPLAIARWKLPARWRQSTGAATEEGETVVVAEGPPIDAQETTGLWSQLILLEQPERSIESAWTRVRVQQNPTARMRALTRVRYRLLSEHQSPLRLQINPQWSVDAVTVRSSGRQIAAAGGDLVIWPTRDEAAEESFEIDVATHRNLPGNREQLVVPATWIVQPSEHVGPQLISIQPPKLRRWDGGSVMLPERIDLAELDPTAAEFFSPAPETLLLRSSSGRLPRVAIDSVDVSLSVSLRHEIDSEGGEVAETITVRAETTQPISEMSVLTGDAHDEEFAWTLRRTDQSATINLPLSAVRKPDGDPLGTYTIELEGRDLREYELVGRRFISGDETLTLSLPSVRRAGSQTAEVFLDGRWEVMEFPASVQSVPPHRAEQPPSPVDVLPQHLRYDPLQRPSIRLRRVDRDSLACLVWNQLIELTASSRSEDLIRLFAEVSSRKPMRIRFDPEMELVSLQRNGQPYEPASLREGELIIEPQRQSDQIVLKLRRPHDSSAWLRRCVTPNVSIEGHVLRQRQIRSAAPGTLILFTLNGGFGSIGQGELFENEARGELFLVPRYVAMGFGWVLAAAVFSLSWLVAGAFSRGVDYLFVGLFVVVSASIIWWPWQLPILGWGAVPIVLGTLLHLLLAKPVDAPSASRLETKSEDTRSVQPMDSPEADLSAVARVLLIAASLTLIDGGRVFAQGNGDELPGEEGVRNAATESTAATPIELLVPLDESHRPVGDKLYLAQSDYDSILQAVDPDRPVDADFQSAEYRVTLSAPRESTNVIAAEIQADYHIRLPRRTTRVRLPVRAETLRRIEILSGDETQIARFVIDDQGLVTATIPPDDEVRLRVTFVPTLSVINTAAPAAEAAVAASATEGQPDAAEPVAEDPEETSFGDLAEDRRSTILTLAIPPIHASTVVVEAPREITVESLGDTLGETRFRAPLGRYEADLGPVNELVITCRVAKPQGQQRPTSIQRMYRIAAGIESTIVECEIDPMQPGAEGESIQLTILGRAPDGLTSKGWRIVNPETSDGAERVSTATANLSGGIYRFVKRSDSETPIRLLWRLPSVLNDPTSTNDSKLMPIPEVFSSGAARGAATLFAIESASTVRVSELTTELQSVSVDDFLAAWRGYPGKIERAFVSRDSFPSFALLRNKLPQPVVDVRHTLHVDQDRIELGLRAEIVDLEAGIKRVLVAVPKSFRLVSCAINGQPVASLPSAEVTSGRKDRATVLPLGDSRVEGKMTIELAAERPPIGSQRLPLPRFEVLNDGEIDGGYRITRDRSVEVRVTTATQPTDQGEANGKANGEVMPETPKMNAADLRVGRIPVAELNADADATFRVRRLPAGNAFPCDQTTVLRYDDGRWFCDTLLKLPAATSPAFVDVQMPSRWTSGLAVSGADRWVQQRSGDGATTVVRLALPAAVEDATQTVIVSGNLDNRDQVRVSVPDVVVLGAGTRDKFLAVPNQLTTETIQWQPRSVRPIRAASGWETPFGSRIEFPEIYSLFAADGPSWSIELEPISQATVDPFAVACDANVILSGGQVLVHQRFDILPETLASVDIRLPENAICLGAWAAEREIDLSDIRASSSQPSRDGETDAEPRGLIELPLAYNRLPQSLEILFRVPVADRQIDDYLARLHGVPTTNRWVVFYDAANRSGARRLLVSGASLRDRQTGDAENLTRERLVSLARAIVTAIDRSRDMLAERSNEEIQQWLMPWIERYRSLASLDGHAPQLTVTKPPEADNAENVGDQDPASSSPWPALDKELRQLIGRFLPGRIESTKPLFAPLRFQSYDPVAVVRLDNLRELPTLQQTFVPRKSLQRLLIDWITLITFGLGVILLWPFRGRFQGWVTHPAMWLFLTGAVSVVLIPPPISVSLMLLAASLPILRGARRLA